MRTIKFRGKDAETGEWLVGDIIQRIGYFPSILFPYNSNGKIHYSECAVDTNTIGQFIGLHDMEDIDIYEGDIVEWVFFYYEAECLHKGVIEWYQGGFAFNVIDNDIHDAGWYGISDLNTDTGSDVRIIGNIYDNPIPNYMSIEDKLNRIYSEIPVEDRNTDTVINL